MPILGPGRTGISTPDVIESMFSGLVHTWTGPDGTVIDLTDLSGGIVLGQAGIRGLEFPQFVRYTSTAPGIAGSRWHGRRTLERPVFWTVYVNSLLSSAEWSQRDSTLWDSLSPDQLGTWAVTDPVAKSTRTLRCRYNEDDGSGYDHDPFAAGWSSYGIYLVAEQPYWTDPDIVREFDAPADIDFFVDDGGTSGDVFDIAPGGSTDSASIPNPGKEPAWPRWTVTDVAGATLAAGGGSVTVNTAVGVGVVLSIDTDPNNQVATDSTGADRTADVTFSALPIPPGTEVPLTISLDTPGDTAQVTCTITPQHWRAFG